MPGGSHTRILIVGFGNMGRALVRGWLDGGIAAAAIVVADESEAARAQASAMGLALAGAEADDFDVLVLAVKPQHVNAAIRRYGAQLSDGGVVLSIAAGRTIASLQQELSPATAIVRSMPNTPAAIAQGTTVMCANAAVGSAQREFCTTLLSAVGAVFWVDDEAQLDAVTALSGSGPAYVFLLIECLTAAAIRQGLPQDLADQLARHTVAGAGAYALGADTGVATLREQVTSPGGTTAAALEVLMRDDALAALFDAAIAAATTRSRELARAQK